MIRVCSLRRLARKGLIMTDDVSSPTAPDLLAQESDGPVATERPAPRFRAGQYVKTSPKHFSQMDFLQIHSDGPRWSNGHWRYGICYVDRSGKRGGSSFSWREEDFEELSDPVSVLCAARLEQRDLVADAKRAYEDAVTRLDELESAVRTLDSLTAVSS